MAFILPYFISNFTYGQSTPAASLNFDAQKIYTSSAAQTFTIRGNRLNGPVTVSTNPPFSLSKYGEIYQSSITYDTTEILTNQTVYVRFKPTVIGNFADSVVNISIDAENKIISLTGKSVAHTSKSYGNSLDANNIITPNGDGVNDTWQIKNIDQYPNNTVKVFDKHGHVIYNKQGYTNDWDGTYNNGSLPQGTYYYLVDFGENLGLTFKGYFTIVRD